MTTYSSWCPAVALGPATSPEQLEEILHQHPHAQIVLRIARHPRATQHLLEDIAQQGESTFPEAAAHARKRLDQGRYAH